MFILTSVITLLCTPPRGCNYMDSQPAMKCLCHHVTADPPNTSAPNASCNHMGGFCRCFFQPHTQNLTAYHCSTEISHLFCSNSDTLSRVLVACSPPRFFSVCRVKCVHFPPPTHMVVNALSCYFTPVFITSHHPQGSAHLILHSQLYLAICFRWGGVRALVGKVLTYRTHVFW